MGVCIFGLWLKIKCWGLATSHSGSCAKVLNHLKPCFIHNIINILVLVQLNSYELPTVGQIRFQIMILN